MKDVLIVDDNSENLYLLELLLKRTGFRVHLAENGVEALDLLKGQKMDLIISDILMPEMDGFSLCRSVKSDDTLSRIPFVFYTATYTDEKDEAYALKLGAEMFIRKPMDPQRFMDKIKQLTDQLSDHPRVDTRNPLIDEAENYKIYSERLIQKLEKKMQDLETEIQRRKEVEIALRRVRNEWHETFQAIGSPTFLLAPDFSIIHANRYAVEQLQTTEAELIGRKCFEVMHQTDAPPPHCPAEKLLESGEKEYVESEMYALGGTYLINCAPLKNEQGQIEKIIHIAIDITDRKEIENRLKESEARYRRLTDNAKDMIYRMSIPDGRYEFVSSAAVTLFGYSPQEFYATPSLIGQVMHPNWVGYFKRQWNRLIKGEMPPTYEYQIIHKDGEMRWMHQRNTLVRNDNNEPIAIEAIVTDISPRKQMEAELKESEEKFRQLVENIHEIFWIRDVEHQSIRYVSPMFEKVFKISAEKVYRDPDIVDNLILQEDLDLVRKARNDQITQGKSTDIVYRVRVDGEVRWIRSKGFPVRDENGTTVRVVGVAEDITLAKQAEAERKELEAQLIHTQKMEAIGTLAGGIAHDFNNILSSIIGFTEISLDDLEPGSTLHQNLSEVFSAGRRAKELVQQILTLAKRSEDEIRPIKLSRITHEALSLIRATIPANIEIIQTISTESRILAPAAQIHQVLMNLLTNAAQAMEEDGGVLEVALTDVMLEQTPVADTAAFTPGNYLRLTVADTGRGIAPKDLTHIFDPYFTTKEIGQGTGLGLSITHGIIQRYGGYITVESSVGKGTIFRVYLPTTAKLESASAKPRPLPAGSEHILVVDDEPAIAKLMVQRLKRLGYSAVARTGSLEALALFQETPDQFDLVISDMTMPQMSGAQLAAELLRIRPDIPIILCTGYSSRVSERSKANIDVDAVLMKPLSMEELARAIRAVLDQ